MNTKQIIENLTDKFDSELIIHLLRGKTRTIKQIEKPLPQYNDENFSACLHSGEFTLENQDKMIVVTVKVNKDLSERSGKKAQYTLGKKILKDFNSYIGGFFIFYDSKNDFRFSLIYDIPLATGKRDWSNFRRYTYFVSKEQTNKTFINQFTEADFSSIEKIIDAFSVEKVTKEFYTEIANWYFWAMDMVEFPDDEDKNRENRNAKNLIRLITRMIFIWFMKEKNLIPLELFNKEDIDKIINYSDKTGSTYYKAILQNLFFATLNTKMKKDEPKSRIFIEEAEKHGYINDGHFEQGYYRYSRFIKNKDLFLKQFEKVPFLNGGLFESLDKEIDGKKIRIDCFSDNPKNETRLKIPDELFFLDKEIEVDLSKYLPKGARKKVSGLLTILKRYNFTIDENTPIDQDVALDPELLGKVFENLLAAYVPETASTARKATGSYYTPREIVEYMVDESLIAFLKNKMIESDNKWLDNEDKLGIELKKLLSYDDITPDFTQKEKETLIDAIEKMKVLDPACGSGAFPMGILHKLVLALHKLDPQNEIWKKRLLERVPAEIRHETEMSLQNKSIDYIRKLGLIENCIYGVDIQEIAIQISKLRFFISLLVEQEIDDTKENRDIRALPNLETKFVAANTLIGLDRPKQTELVGKEIEELENNLFKVREEIFYTNSRREKQDLQKREKQLREQLKVALKQNGFKNEVAEKISNWDPFDQNTHSDWFDPEWMFGITDGFDIVIGNPPYGIVYEENLKSIYESYYITFKRNNDIYVAFYHKGLILVKPNGVLNYISANTFLNGDYFKQLRKYLTSNSRIIEIIDHKNVKVFENATVMTCIFLTIKNVVKEQYHCSLKQAIESYNNLKDYTLIIDYNSDKELKAKDQVIVKIYSLKNINFIDNLFLVKDVGFNYWSIGRKKIRGKNSIGDRIFYTGEKKNLKDIPFLKGRNLFRYYHESPSNYLRHNYIELLDENDVFRFSEEFLKISPKIIYRQTADKIIATIDEKSYYLDKTVHLIIQKFNHKIELKYLLGLLNSKLFYHIYKHISQEMEGRTFSQVKTTYIKKLPVLLISPLIQKHIIELVDKILLEKKQNAKIDTQHLEDQIDIMVYKLYELNYEEVKIIDPEIEKIISEKEYEKYEIL